MGKCTVASELLLGDAKHRTRNLEIPGLVLAHHPGMTKDKLVASLAMTGREWC